MSGKADNFFKRLLKKLSLQSSRKNGLGHKRIAIEESELRYQALVEHAPIAIIVHQEGKIKMANQMAVDLVDAPNKHTLIGYPVLDLVHPDYLPLVKDRVARLYAEGGTAPLAEEVFLKLDGTPIEVEVVGSRIIADGKPAIQVMVRDISSRKQDRQTLLKAKEQAEHYFSMAGTIMFVLNAEGEVEVINKKGAQTIGLPEEEIVGKSWMEHFVPEEIRGFLQEKLEEAVRDGVLDLNYFENEIIRADGSRRLVAWHNRLLLDDEGRFNGIIASGEDITFQRKAEALLKSRDLSLREAERIALLGSWMTDPVTEEGEWSETMYQIMERDQESGPLLREDFIAMVHPDDREQVMTGIQKLFEQGIAVNLPFRIQLPSGNMKYLEGKGAVKLVRDKGVQKEVVYGTFQDITERKLAEEALRVSEQKYRTLFEQNLSGVFRIDLNEPKSIIECNRAFAQMLGFSHPEELRGKSIKEIFDSVTSAEYFDAILEHGQLFNWESILTLHNGRTIHTLENSTLVYEDDRPRYLEGTVFDITALKQAEAERTQLIDQLIWQNKNLEEFAYVVSHNLRSPVASLLGLAQLAASDKEDLRTIHEVLERITTVATSLDNVLKDLNNALTVQKKQTLHKEALDIGNVIAEIQNILQSEMDLCGATIDTSGLAVTQMVSVRSYVHNILYNLVHNAIKYRHPDREPLIRISSTMQDEGIEITVEDNGLGLDTDKIGEKLYGLYQRFHIHVPGKGIGLYLVKSQVEALGGHISAEGTVDKGAVFRVVLP